LALAEIPNRSRQKVAKYGDAQRTSSWQAKRRFSGPTLRVTIGESEGLDAVNTFLLGNGKVGGWVPSILWATGFVSPFWSPGLSFFSDGISSLGAGLAGAILGGVLWGQWALS